MNAPDTKLKSQQGMILLEAMIAILLFSLGVLALIGLQAAMIKNTSDSKYRADASYIAQQKIGQIWADPDNALGYIVDNTDISDLLPNGLLTVAQPDPINVPSQFMVTVTWREPGQPAHRLSTTAIIAGA